MAQICAILSPIVKHGKWYKLVLFLVTLVILFSRCDRCCLSLSMLCNFRIIYNFFFHSGNKKIVDLLLKNGVDYKQKDVFEQSAADLAVLYGKTFGILLHLKLKIVQNVIIYLIEKKEIAESLKEFEDEHMTLHEAFIAGKTEKVLDLVQKGDVNSMGFGGETALHLAAKKG